MTLYLKIFSLILCLSGLIGLYQHFDMIGSVSSVGEVLNSAVLTRIFLLTIGVGMAMRQSWARLGAMGLCLVGIVMPLVGLIYAIFNFRQIATGFIFVALMLQAFPVFLNNMAGYIVIGILATLFFVWIFWRAYSQLRSDEALFYYNDRPWFDRNFEFRNIDLRPILFSLVFMGFNSIDKIIPKSMTRELDRKVVTSLVKDMKTELNKDPEFVRRQEQAKLEKEKRHDDSRSANFIQFTNDESKIWIIAADKKINLVDLRTFKWTGFDFGSYHRDRARDLASDGRYFYSPDKKAFIKTTDGSSIPIANGQLVFLGFSQNSDLALFFNQQSNKLSLTNFLTQQEIWSVDATTDRSPPKFSNGVIWSADRKIAVFGSDKNYSVINVANGQIQKAEFQFRYPEYNYSNPRSNLMLMSGPVAFDQNYKSYWIDTSTSKISEIPLSNAIIGFDFVSRIYLTKNLGEIKFLKIDSPTDPAHNSLQDYSNSTLKLTGQPWAMVIHDQDEQFSFVNLQSGEKIKAGRMHNRPRPIETGVTKIAASPSGQLSVVGVRNKFEVFWTSELGKEKPRTWAFDLDIQAKK